MSPSDQMLPPIVITVDASPSELGPLSTSPMPTPVRSRILYCRKCEGHGEKVILKNHAPGCPYILCACRSCEKLNYKRLKSFNKRNKEKLELAAALNAQRRAESAEYTEEEGSRRSSFSSCTDSPSISNCSMDGEPTRKQSTSSRTGLEGRSMSLGAMTVMSYDIWKAKCAAEKKRLEAEGKIVGGGDVKVDDEQQPSGSPPARKRAHTFVARDEPKEIPKVSPPNLKEKKGRYILLPTIPAMKVFVGEDAPAIVPSEPANIPQENPPVTTTSTAPLSLPTFSAAPTLPLPAPLPRPSPIAVTAPNFFNPLSSVAPAPTTTTPAFGAGFTTDQLLASLLPSSLLLQNAGLLQQNVLANLLGLAATTPILPPPSTSCASDVLALLRAQQSAQLAAALAVPAKNSLLPSSGSPDDLIQTLLAQSRQPIFSHSL